MLAITLARRTPFAPTAKGHLVEVTTTTMKTVDMMTRTMVRVVAALPVHQGQGVAARK